MLKGNICPNCSSENTQKAFHAAVDADGVQGNLGHDRTLEGQQPLPPEPTYYLGYTVLIVGAMMLVACITGAILGIVGDTAIWWLGLGGAGLFLTGFDMVRRAPKGAEKWIRQVKELHSLWQCGGCGHKWSMDEAVADMEEQGP